MKSKISNFFLKFYFWLEQITLTLIIIMSPDKILELHNSRSGYIYTYYITHTHTHTHTHTIRAKCHCLGKGDNILYKSIVRNVFYNMHLIN